jgi:hypothetical protein
MPNWDRTSTTPTTPQQSRVFLMPSMSKLNYKPFFSLIFSCIFSATKQTLKEKSNGVKLIANSTATTNSSFPNGRFLACLIFQLCINK